MRKITLCYNCCIEYHGDCEWSKAYNRIKKNEGKQ